MSYLNLEDRAKLLNDKEFEIGRKPRLYVLPEARMKLDIYINSAKGEITGMGTLTKFGDDYLVEDVYLLEQEASSTHATIDPAALAKFQFEMMRDGVAPETIKLWWHSHANMPVFWSSQDDRTIDGFRNQWMISIVGNKDGEWKARFDIYEPVRCTIHNLPFDVLLEQPDDLVEELQQEVAEKVRQPPKKKKEKTKTRNSIFSKIMADIDDDDLEDIRGETVIRSSGS